VKRNESSMKIEEKCVWGLRVLTEMVAKDKTGLRVIMRAAMATNCRKLGTSVCNTFLNWHQEEGFQSCFQVLHPTSKWDCPWRIGLQQQGNYFLLEEANISRLKERRQWYENLTQQQAWDIGTTARIEV
jgi:hypothetical protein